MDKKPVSLKFNFIMNALLTMSSILFPLITFPYVSRILLPEGTGKVAFATSFVSYFTLLSQLGIPTYGIRACAKVRDDKAELSRTVQELLIINLIMSAIVYILLAGVIAFVPRFREEWALYLVISSSILFNAIGMEWLFKGLEQYAYITVRSVAFKILALIGMFLLVHKQSDYIFYGGLSIFAASASGLLNFIHARRYISLRPMGEYHLRRHLKAVAVFFAMSCAASIYTHIDSTMLGIMVNDTVVGYYDAAIKVRTALLGFVTSLGAVMLPRSSYYIQHGQHAEFMRVSEKALNFVFLLATPLAVFFILFAQPCIYLLSGEAYHGSILPMQCIIPTLVLVGITNIWGLQMLVPLGKEKVVLYSEIAGAITDLIMNALLIPSLKASGAAIGTLTAEMVVLIVQLVYLREVAFETLRGIHIGRIVVALLLASTASCWVRMLHLGSFAMLLLGASIFFGIYGAFLIRTREPLVIEISDQVMSFLRAKGKAGKVEES